MPAALRPRYIRLPKLKNPAPPNFREGQSGLDCRHRHSLPLRRPCRRAFLWSPRTRCGPPCGRPSTPPPGVSRNSRLAEFANDPSSIRLLASLTVDPLHDLVERIAIDRITEPGFRRREHVPFLIDAEVLLVWPVRCGDGMRHLEPVGIGHRQFQVEVHREIGGIAPVVRRAFQVELAMPNAYW